MTPVLHYYYIKVVFSLGVFFTRKSRGALRGASACLEVGGRTGAHSHLLKELCFHTIVFTTPLRLVWSESNEGVFRAWFGDLGTQFGR
jgi:hypothetical protein